MDDIADRVAGGRRNDDPPPLAAALRHAPPDSEPPNGTGLFRPEAFERPGASGFGRPISQLPAGWRILSFLIVAIVGAALWLLISNSYERRETARGLLRSAGGDAQLIAPERGTVRSVAVAEGDLVRAGQTLITISTDRAQATGAIPIDAMLASLDAQERSLRLRLSAIGATDHLETDVAHAQARALAAARASAQTDLNAARGQLEIAENEFARFEPLVSRGFVTRTDLVRRQQAVIAARQAMGAASGQIARTDAQIAEQRSVAAKRPFASIRERGEIEDSLAEIEQRRVQLRASRGYALRAPVDGRISTVQTAPGQVVDPMRPLLAVIPADAPMVAVLYVPSRGIGFLRAGQRVRLRYDAFPFQAFGAAGATIRSVSHTVLRPEDVEGAIRLEEPAYRVVATLDRQRMAGFDRSHPLYPGMALSADIILERRSFAAWLFEPLLAMRGRLTS